MKKTQRWFSIFVLLGLLLAPLAGAPTPAAAQTVYTCLPTCTENDARFLTIAGVGLQTMVGLNMSLKIAVPEGRTSFEVGVFDGDTGGFWDIGSKLINFTLYADPTARGAQLVEVAEWTSADMSDNTWSNRTFSTGANAQSLAGAYFYHLRVWVETPDASTFYNNFKVRSDGVVGLLPRPFSFYASLNNAIDIVYPNFPDLSVTTYNGIFDFHTDVASSLSAFRLWDGDMDFGTVSHTDSDTDDPDTPNDSIPSWSTPGTAFEGVAVGLDGSTGAPSDDNTFIYYVRSPSVRYYISPLDQTPYWNNNPSGNLEWEQFSISSVPGELADHNVSGRLPAGLYHVHMEGMDMNNLNAWRFKWDIVGVCVPDEEGDPNPCVPMPHPNLIGDYVWADANEDGVQDAGEAPIAGVRVELFDGYGAPLLDYQNNPIFAITDANGLYHFNVEPRTVDEYTNEVVISGEYTVVVSSSNFQAGGALFGMHSTTGGNSHTDTVIDQNILTYDFGYWTGVPDRPDKVGPFQSGWWRKHPARWPAGPFTIGGVTYSRQDALNAMFMGGRDVTYRFFRQVLAVTLNVAMGYESSCIVDDLATANAWLVAHPLGSGVLADNPAWTEIAPTYEQLMLYNAGRLCARRRP